MELLTDEDIFRLVTPRLAAQAMRDAVVAAWRGELTAPPRVSVGLGQRRLVYTCGAVAGDWFGYRSYVAPGSAGDDQVVVVQDSQSGRLRALAVGQALGPRRTGAIGAVALDALVPHTPEVIALIGCGRQAWHQLWALPERFRHVPVRVYSPSPAHRSQFASRARDDLGLDVSATPSVGAAVDEAAVIVLATSSATPVLHAQDIPAGAFVSTLGPKQQGRSEFGRDLTDDAELVVTDSVEQIRAYDPPHVLAGTDVDGSMVHLGAVLTGAHRVPDATRVFFNAGLAGTEAWLLNAAIQSTTGHADRTQ